MSAYNLSEPAAKKHALSIALLLLVPTLLLAIPGAADSEGGSVTTFAGGGSTDSIETSGNSFNASSSLDSPRNITYQTASFEIEYSSDDPSPGQLWLDINMDGDNEWAWGTGGISGMGSVGLQTEFDTGADNDSHSISSGTVVSNGVILPGNSQLLSSQLSATFTPTVGGGLFSIGELLDVAVGNIDSDPLPEIIFLSDEPNGNSSANKSIGWMEWDSNNSSFSNVSWAETCSAGGELRLGDVNNDGRVDIGVVLAESSSMCIHLSNTSVGGYTSTNMNVSVGEGMTDIDFADLDGDGFSDVVSIHGMGELSTRLFRNATSSFADNLTQVIFPNGSAGPMAAQLEELAVGELNGTGTGWYVIVADGEEHLTAWNYNLSMQSWVEHPKSFDGAKADIHLVDINSDGYLDTVGTTDMGHMVAIYNGSEWNSSTGSMVSIHNSTFADVDGDGVLDVITPTTGNTDGSDATFVGELVVRPVNASGIGAQVINFAYEPVTAPTQIKISDLDGDGVLEHIVAGGESNPGIYIAGWHHFSIDIDQDGTPEGSETGYAGDGTAGQGPLNWMDDSNAVKDAIDTLQLSATLSQDMWDNNYFTTHFDISANGEGTVLLDSLNLSYDVTFTVDNNPHASGNLSNVLNQLMQAGTGTFNIPIPFNSTSAGTITLKNLAAVYTAGAPQLELPPTPTLNLVGYDSNMVQFDWHDGMGLNNFVHFQIFRVENGTALDTTAHILDTTILNMTLDVSVVPGTTYDYFVRSVHSFGVASNLSEVLTVAIPYPGLIPSPLTTIVDRAEDDGGWLSISWEDPNSSTLDHFDIYLSSTQFSNISDMTPVATLDTSTFAINISESSEGELVDGVPYWGACIPVDIYDRSITSVVAVGPVLSRNDSQLAPELVVHVFGEEETSSLETIARGSELSIRVSLTAAGLPLADSAVNLSLSESSERAASIAWKRSYTGITDSNGTWNPIQEEDWGDIIGSQHMHGTVIVVATYAGFEGDDANQPISAGVDSAEFETYVSATVAVNSTQVRVDADGFSEVSATISTTAEDLSAVISEVELEYRYKNETDDIDFYSSTLFDSTGAALVRTSSLPNGGALELYVILIPYWLQVDGHLPPMEEAIATIEVLPPFPVPEEEENNTENETQTEDLIDPVLTCDPITIPLKDPGSDISTPCQAYNMNTFSIDIDLSWVEDWSEYEELSASIQPSSLEAISGQTSALFEIRFSWSGDITDSDDWYEEGKTLSLMAYVHHNGITEPINYGIPITINDNTEIIPNPNDGGTGGGGDDNTSLDENVSAGEDSKLLTYAMYAGGGILGLGIVIVAGSMLFGGRSDLDDEDDEEDDWEDSFSTFDEDAPSASKALSRVNRPDSVKFQERRNKPEPEPEPEPEYYEPEYEEEWQEESDDGITVDEDGTEWWEDEVGVWWYRTPEMDDWAEFEE